MVRRQKAIAEKEEVTKAKARALDEKKRAEKKAALAKKVGWKGKEWRSHYGCTTTTPIRLDQTHKGCSKTTSLVERS